MSGKSRACSCLLRDFLLLGLCLLTQISANGQSTYNLRVMSANLNGNSQSYQPFALRIFQGLKPDIVAIQEFNFSNNTPADFRYLLDNAFGPEFVYYRETGYDTGIPNGIISRYPIVASGTWDDPLISNRGFAWARIDLPGSNDLYVVSVHLYSSGSASDRNTEATVIKTNILAYFPANAWIVVAGDFNTDTRTEAAVATFKTFLSDDPIPTDAESGGNPNTNATNPRNKPYDYVLPSLSLAPFLTNSVFASHSFSNGLVFDSRVYTPLSDVAPVLSTDSPTAQHMAVIKDFNLGNTVTNAPGEPPVIAGQPQSQTVRWGGNATFGVSIAGALPFAYQWRLHGTNIPGATGSSYTRAGVQHTDAGPYSVAVTNDFGGTLSSNGVLTVDSTPFLITPPASKAVVVGEDVSFTASAGGEPPLNCQWTFNGSPISGATGTSLTLAKVQSSSAGSYAVVVTNYSGSVTSVAAVLTVTLQPGTTIAQWNFNSAVADANTGTGTTLPSVGAGTAALVGGVTEAFYGGSANDPAPSADNSGWSTTTYPASGNNKSAGVEFRVSTAGRRNIVIRWDQRASNTGSKYSRLQYTTNGSAFIDFPSATVLSAAGVFEARTNDLSGFSGVDDNPNFAFRIVAEFQSTATGTGSPAYVGAGGTYASGGTVRFDMVTVSGSPMAATAPPSLSAPVMSASQFQFNVTGVPGLSYVVEASTNLVDWTSLETNTSPFSFTDTSAPLFPIRLYRARLP